MTWRVHIEHDVRVDGIAIQIAQRLGEGGHVDVLRFEPTHEVVQGVASMPTPSLVIGDDLGRALLDALSAHYGGATGGRQQRADFEHERARVDKLIGCLITEGRSP
jgi:hypothetical protein